MGQTAIGNYPWRVGSELRVKDNQNPSLSRSTMDIASPEWLYTFPSLSSGFFEGVGSLSSF